MTPDPVALQIAEFLGKYMPEIAQAMAECRRKMQALVPRGWELVFDNYNALVFGYAPTLKSSESILSIAGYPRWVTLFFLHGISLHDPHSLLEGSGSQVRGIRLAAPTDLDDPRVCDLIAQALAPHADAFAKAPSLTTVVKMVAAKQRPRRPKLPKPPVGLKP